MIMLLSLLVSLIPCGILGFSVIDLHQSASYRTRNRQHVFHDSATILRMALGDFSVEMEKPLGIILEEQDAGVRVKEILEGGSAFASGRIVPGDILLQVDETDVSVADFDTVMDILGAAASKLRLTLGDGLGTMDMPKNLLKTLKPEEAMLVDSVVRAAVREIRRSGRLGDLLRVEIVIGAGVRDNGKRCLVRFFAIFSTDGVTTYSCNVAATGLLEGNGSIKIVSLSCAKDEGLGQTIDLIYEKV